MTTSFHEQARCPPVRAGKRVVMVELRHRVGKSLPADRMRPDAHLHTLCDRLPSAKAMSLSGEVFQRQNDPGLLAVPPASGFRIAARKSSTSKTNPKARATRQRPISLQT